MDATAEDGSGNLCSIGENNNVNRQENTRSKEEERVLKRRMGNEVENGEEIEKRVKVVENTEKEGFPRFPLLPVELRQMVYSKMVFVDRIATVKALPESLHLFMKHPVKKVEVMMSVEKQEELVYICISYNRQFVERFRIPKNLEKNLQNELEIYKKCCCQFCGQVKWWGSEPMRVFEGVRYYKYDSRNVQKVFDTMRMVEILRLELKTVPFGGLVDFLHPIGHLQNMGIFRVYWHLSNGTPEDSRKHIDIGRWERWLDFLRPSGFSIEQCLVKVLKRNSEQAKYWYSPDVNIPEAFLDLPSVRNANTVCLGRRCMMDFTYQQLTSLKAKMIFVDVLSNLLSPTDLLEFFKVKLKEWISAPDTMMLSTFGYSEEEEADLPLHFDKLLEDVSEKLRSPEFLVEHCSIYFHHGEENRKFVKIRSTKTGWSLEYSPYRLETYSPEELRWDYTRPEKLEYLFR